LSMCLLHKLLSQQINLWKRNTNRQCMNHILKSLQSLGKNRLDKSSTPLLRQQRTIPMSNFPSLLSVPLLRSMILRDMPYKLSIPLRPDKIPQDSLNTQLRRQQNMIPPSNFPSQM